MNAKNSFRAESLHRETAPMIEWNHVVRLSNGRCSRINRFDYNMAFGTTRYVQMFDGAWIRVDRVERLPESQSVQAGAK